MNTRPSLLPARGRRPSLPGRTRLVLEPLEDRCLLAIGMANGLVVFGTGRAPLNAVVASFTDTIPNATPSDFSVAISWGDGQTTPGTVTPNTQGGFDVIGNHTYALDASYTIAITATDSVGQTGSSDCTAHVACPTGPPPLLGAVARTFTHSTEYCNNLVTAAYQRYLSRSPDPAGLANWVNALQAGLKDEQLEAGFIGAPEYIQNHGGSGAGWVQSMYQDLLGRTPSQSEVDGWVNALQAGMSPTQVAYGFAASAEREGQRITADYEDYLGRAPEPGAVANWVSAFTHGLSNEDVIAGFVGSPEYFNNHFGDSPDWLTGAYQDILGRAADAAGFAAWLADLRESP
jgi:hypothetical protein